MSVSDIPVGCPERDITSDTTVPDTDPVKVPLDAVLPHVPVKDEPSWEMLTVMTQEVVRAVSHVVPVHFPATFAVEGALGVESHDVAAMVIARATAASLKACMSALTKEA